MRIGEERRSTVITSAKFGRSYKGTVSKVYDGDTLHVIDVNGAKHKIRMAYIDAPEMKQAYGTRSRDNLRTAAEGRKVSVRVFETDRYQREVAQVSAGKTDLNLMQVEDGAAWHYESYARKQQDKADFADYADAQSRAKKDRKGLWKDKSRRHRGHTVKPRETAEATGIGQIPWANGWESGKDAV